MHLLLILTGPRLASLHYIFLTAYTSPIPTISSIPAIPVGAIVPAASPPPRPIIIVHPVVSPLPMPIRLVIIHTKPPRHPLPLASPGSLPFTIPILCISSLLPSILRLAPFPLLASMLHSLLPPLFFSPRLFPLSLSLPLLLFPRLLCIFALPIDVFNLADRHDCTVACLCLAKLFQITPALFPVRICNRQRLRLMHTFFPRVKPYAAGAPVRYCALISAGSRPRDDV